jgi:hypothetical protein
MDGEEICGSETIVLEVEKSEKVVGSLIRHIFFRTFRNKYKDIIPLTFYPFRILSRQKQDDLIGSHLPNDLKGKLAFRKMVEIQFRKMCLHNKLEFGAVISLCNKWVFGVTCEQLVQEGFKLNGMHVLDSEPIEGLDAVLAPVETLVGRVLTHDSKKATVETPDGNEDFNLDRLFLHRSTYNIASYLRWRLGEQRAALILSKTKEGDLLRLNAKRQFEEIESIAKTVAKLEYVNRDGFTFSIRTSSELQGDILKLEVPIFTFDYTPGKTHKVADIGLSTYGPFDSKTFDKKRPKILVVCHEKNRGLFSAFLDKFKNGIPNTRYFPNGFKQKYCLHEIDFKLVEIAGYDFTEYRKAIDNNFAENGGVDLVFLETRDEFRQMAPERSPYYRVKAHVLGAGIPVQFVQAEKIRVADTELQYLCNTIGLQIYAKLGGTPWLLPASRGVDREIIVGVGSSLVRSTLAAGGAQEKIVGITTFFSGDGNYLLSNRCREVRYEEYFDELLRSLEECIKNISATYGWQKGDTVRIVFHVFKPIKNVEAEVVRELMTRFGDYEMKYAFLTVTSNHPFLLFDPKQREKNAAFVPKRGVNLVVDDSSCILQVRGAAERFTERHGFSGPVLITIHPESTFKDLHFITQQIYYFTALSFRGFLPIRIPITIYYADLIAHLLGKLRRVPEWNPLVINTSLSRKKWFL